ncbi:hypothetical protein [Candidatus Amarolinea dominans]|uniref:hypothetical protein n=1 Tax=Candidatus Amarolinea dominans TaxID=3140696 RepID=UPI0031374951|nr:hypothetical protein [Anaerolineae bacterium]
MTDSGLAAALLAGHRPCGTAGLALAFLLTALPFTLKALRKDWPVGLPRLSCWPCALALAAGLAPVVFTSRGEVQGARLPVLSGWQRAANVCSTSPAPPSVWRSAWSPWP